MEDYKRMFVWREISVDGDIYKLRETRASTRRGDLVVGETNELQVSLFKQMEGKGSAGFECTTSFTLEIC